jgi:hypothetical protein
MHLSKAQYDAARRGKPRIACSSDSDPFEGIPVEQFEAFDGVPAANAARWKKAVGEMRERVHRLKVGGKKLKEEIGKELSKLHALRLELFCPYL